MLEAKGTSGTVRFDGQTVTITREGIVQRSVSQGLHGTASYPIAQLTGVRIQKPGLHAGQFTLIAAGARDVGVRGASGGSDPMTVLFQRRAMANFEKIKNAIEQAIARPPLVTVQQQTPPAAAPSIAEQLERVAALYRDNLISFDEFEAAKAQILGQGQHYAAPGPQDARVW